jgi:hypothetical protein
MKKHAAAKMAEAALVRNPTDGGYRAVGKAVE